MRVYVAKGSDHGGFRPPWRTLLLTGLALALYLLAGPAPELLVYDRSAIASGEWWRLVAGHMVHSDASHVFWDITVLALLGVLLEGRLRSALLPSLLAGAVAINAWLWRETRDPVAVLVGAAVVFKIVVELSTGRVLFTNTAWPGVPSVHAVGFAVGLLLSVVWCLLRRNPCVLLKSKGRRICPSCHCQRIRSTTASGK